MKKVEKQRLSQIKNPVIDSKVATFISDNFTEDGILKESYIVIKQEMRDLDIQAEEKSLEIQKINSELQRESAEKGDKITDVNKMIYNQSSSRDLIIASSKTRRQQTMTDDQLKKKLKFI